MPQLLEFEKKRDVNNQGIYVMMCSNKVDIDIHAPSFDAAEMVLLESKLMSWDTIELAQTRSPEETIGLSQVE